MGVKTRGGKTSGKGRGKYSRARCLTSDEIWELKQEQAKVKAEKLELLEEKKRKALKRKEQKVKYHLAQLAKLQK